MEREEQLTKHTLVPAKSSVCSNLLTTFLAFYLFSGSIMANEQVDKKDIRIAEELRIVVPIGDSNNPAAQENVRNKLLAVKLIKMGRAKSQSCTRCHGRSGMQTLALSTGWERSITEFVVKQLTEFRDGKRTHAVMSSVAAPLSDQDIALIAAWYQSVSVDSPK